MRVSSINAYSYSGQSHKNLKTQHRNMSETVRNIQDTSFKGWRASLNGVCGTAAGVGLGALLTLATGGLAAPLILGAVGCTAGCVGGCAAEEKRGEDSGKDDDSGIDPSDYR